MMSKNPTHLYRKLSFSEREPAEQDPDLERDLERERERDRECEGVCFELAGACVW